MEDTKCDHVWSLDTPEWINFFNNDIFLDYKEFVSRKLPLKYPSLGTSRSSNYPGPYYLFENQRGDNRRNPSANPSTKRMVGCQKLCRLLWLLSCILVLVGILGIIFVTIFIIITDRDREMSKNMNDIVYSTVANIASTAPPAVNVTSI